MIFRKCCIFDCVPGERQKFTMNDHDHSIRIFTGSEIDALALRALLEEAGISSMIRNEYQLDIPEHTDPLKSGC